MLLITLRTLQCLLPPTPVLPVSTIMVKRTVCPCHHFTHTHNTHCNISSCQLHLIPLRLLARARPCFLPHLAPPLARIADIFGFLCFQHHEQDDLSFFRSLCYMLSQKKHTINQAGKTGMVLRLADKAVICEVERKKR